MNHLKTHKTSLMAPWDPLNAPLDPLGTPGPAPPSIPNDPKTGLLNHSPAFQITRRPIKCHCWSYGTSYPSPSGLYSLVLPSSESRVYLADLSSPVWSCCFKLNPKSIRLCPLTTRVLEDGNESSPTFHQQSIESFWAWNMYKRYTDTWLNIEFFGFISSSFLLKYCHRHRIQCIEIDY